MTERGALVLAQNVFASTRFGVAVLAALLLPLHVQAATKAKKVGDVESEIEAELSATEAAPEAAPAAPEELPQIGEDDRLAVFKLQRGLYFSSDLGVFLAFGGYKQTGAKANVSKLQPYLSFKAGFDLSDFLSVQASVASGYVSGSAMSEAELLSGSRAVFNYSLLNLGGEVVAAIRPTERFAIEPKLGGGITRLNPQPTDPDSSPTSLAALPEWTPHVSAGLDLKYLTLLTDFTAGVSLSGYYLPAASVMGVGIGFVVRYTF